MRWDIINQLIKNHNYKKYLEIGYQEGVNFRKIECENKYSVDPNGKADYKGTSDDFYRQNKETRDIIFIDGLHEAKQVKRDIINSIKALNDGGCIVLHDCLPKTFEMQKVPRETNIWTGNVWRAWTGFLTRHEGFTYNIDYGVGIAYKQPLINFQILPEKEFKRRKQYLRLKEWEQH